MIKLISGIASAVFMPAIAFAQPLDRVTNADQLILKISDLARSSIWLFITLAVLFIVWNAVQFIRTAGGDDRKKYQAAVMWGIVGLFVILSLWGLVNILRNTFNVGNSGNQQQTQGDINSLIPGSGGPGASSGAPGVRCYNAQGVQYPC